MGKHWKIVKEFSRSGSLCSIVSLLWTNNRSDRSSSTNSVSLNVFSVHGTVAVEETNVPNLPGPRVNAKAPRLVLISHQSPIMYLCTPACMPTVLQNLTNPASDGLHESTLKDPVAA